MTSARVIIADSERSADLYYASHFLAPDPFVLIEADHRRTLVMSDLEIDRAKTQSSVDEVLSLTSLSTRLKANGRKEPGLVDILDAVLSERSVRQLQVPSTFSLSYADALRQRGYEVHPAADPFYPERMVKSEEEIAHITATLRATEDALATAIELIRNAQVRDDSVLWIGGKPLTAELVRKTMHLTLMERDCVGQHTIIACGVQAVDPHNEGSGPLRANEPIVIDVFPQHATTRYFADLTRTVVKGRASDTVRRMFEAVKAGQAIAYRMIHDGVDGSAIHQAILESFTRQGFCTGEQDGRMQGFFHGTGHGVGLEIHEPPRISPRPDTLRSGMVVTVEPGLYYLDAGGMRLEDMVVVTADGCRLLTQLPKVLEV